jgi:pimeloyl-ACP methyl ester carboxylesterase
MPDIKTIILIHGYGFDDRIWNPVEIAFEGHRVIRLRLPGFDAASAVKEYTIEFLAKNYWQSLIAHDIQQVHLIGHSMGGYVTMEMIAQEPDRVESLCLLHSHVFADSEEKKKGRTGVLEEIRASGKNAFVERMILSMAFDKKTMKPVLDKLIQRGLLYSDDAWYFGTQAIRDRRDHANTLQQFTKPVMMMMGEADVAVPIELAYKQAPLAANNRLVTYPGVGHLSMYENSPAVIRDLISFYE